MKVEKNFYQLWADASYRNGPKSSGRALSVVVVVFISSFTVFTNVIRVENEKTVGVRESFHVQAKLGFFALPFHRVRKSERDLIRVLSSCFSYILTASFSFALVNSKLTQVPRQIAAYAVIYPAP